MLTTIPIKLNKNLAIEDAAPPKNAIINKSI